MGRPDPRLTVADLRRLTETSGVDEALQAWRDGRTYECMRRLMCAGYDHEAVGIIIRRLGQYATLHD